MKFKNHTSHIINPINTSKGLIKFLTVIALPVLSLSLILTGCGATTGKVQNLGPAKFAAAIQKDGSVILDVRTPNEFAAGHIKGAINIDVEANDFSSKIEQLDPQIEYAIYCHSGRRSAIAVNKMADAGFTKLLNLEGGVNAWLAANYQLVTN